VSYLASFNIGTVSVYATGETILDALTEASTEANRLGYEGHIRVDKMEDDE
jgi:hypothetical protein